MKYVTVLVLYVIFSVAAMLAGVAGIVVGLVRRDLQYTANVMHSMDMLLAALLGWNGRATVSKECGRSTCRFCRVVCAILHRVLERYHCAKEAQRE